jgi:hypothetical protein
LGSRIFAEKANPSMPASAMGYPFALARAILFRQLGQHPVCVCKLIVDRWILRELLGVLAHLYVFCLPKSRGSKFQRPLKQGINLWSCVAACAALLHLRSFAFFGASRRMSAAGASLQLAGGDLQPSQSESCVQERFFPWVKASLSQRLCEPSARWGVRVCPGVGRFLCSLLVGLHLYFCHASKAGL